MPTLKTTRGTVLYANVSYIDAAGAGQYLLARVFNLGIGGLKARSLLLEDGSERPFETLIPEMAGAQINQFALSISYPDGGFAQPPSLGFGPAIEYDWADALILQHQPTVDPDWRNNATYLTISGIGVTSG